MTITRRTAALAAAAALTGAAALGTAEASADAVAHAVVVVADRTMAGECGVVGAGAYASVSILACYATNGVTAPVRSMPGPANATVFTGTTNGMPGSFCIRATATDINGRTYDTGMRCQPLTAGVNIVTSETG